MAESQIKKNLEKILKDRKKKVEEIHRQAEELLQQKESSLERLNQIYSKYSSLTDKEKKTICNAEAFELLESLPQKRENLLTSFNEAGEALAALESRFSRPTVNLVVIGAMGAGKSKFLQSASGLPDACIPSYSGASCTGVTSIIENSAAETEAVFTFKTTKEVIEEMDREIRSFAYRLHAADKLSPISQFSDGVKNLNTLAGILNLEGKKIIGDEGIERLVTDSDRIEVSNLLKIYDTHRSDWESYLEDSNMGKGDPDLELLETAEGRKYVLKNKQKIEEYVSKHNESDTQKYYKYVAVKKAVIRTKFSDSIDADIRLIDTVGIGDPSVDTERRMLEAINDEADGVIFLLGGTDRHENQVTRKDRPLIEKFQEIYNSYRRKEDKDQKETKYWMAFLVNSRPMEGAAENYGQKYLESAIIPSFSSEGQVFANDGIEFKRAINVGVPLEVEEMLSEFLKNISAHLKEIDNGMEKFALNATKYAKANDKAFKDALGSIHINISSNSEKNYITKLQKERVTRLRKKLGEYKNEKFTGTASERQKSFLQQSLDKVNLLKKGETLTGFSVGACKNVSLRGIIDYYNSHKEFENNPPRARLAVFEAVQGIVRQIGSLPLDEQRREEEIFKQDIAKMFVEELGLDSKKLGDGLVQELDISAPHFFDKMSRKLLDGLVDTEDVAKAFRSLDQFKLDQLNGITKALFCYFSAECIKDTPYEEQNIWEEWENIEDKYKLSEKELLQQELEQKLDEFMAAIKSRTGDERYLVDQNDQKNEELMNFIHVLEPDYYAVWLRIFDSMCERKLLLEDSTERERLGIVDAIAQDIDMQLRSM